MFSLTKLVLRRATPIPRKFEMLFSTKGRKPIKVGQRSTTTPKKKSVGEEPWVEVKDDQTGQFYYWNKVTDETTALGASRPIGKTATVVVNLATRNGGFPAPAPTNSNPQGEPGLGSMVAQGMAWGAGMGIARAAVSSVFNLFD